MAVFSLKRRDDVRQGNYNAILIFDIISSPCVSSQRHMDINVLQIAYIVGYAVYIKGELSTRMPADAQQVAVPKICPGNQSSMKRTCGEFQYLYMRIYLWGSDECQNELARLVSHATNHRDGKFTSRDTRDNYFSIINHIALCDFFIIDCKTKNNKNTHTEWFFVKNDDPKNIWKFCIVTRR